MSISTTPSIFQGERVIELPDTSPIMDLNKVYAQEKPDAQAYYKAFEPYESQKSPSTDNAFVFQSQPVLEQVAVPVEVKTFDFKYALIFLAIGFVIFKFYKKR
jgi:hypothetical protein